jgi:hypothetical protein
MKYKQEEFNGQFGINVFSLGQNIPHSVKNSPRIDYSIPESGEVVFSCTQYQRIIVVFTNHRSCKR